MTAQAHEIVVVDGVMSGLCTEPLQGYLDSMEPPPQFDWASTACWRGYIGHWAIKDDVFYLTDIHLECPRTDNFHWRVMFDNKEGDIKADWYSGTLRIPQGKLLEYVHGGYESQYEKDLLITIDQGKVTKREIINNKNTQKNIAPFNGWEHE